MHRTLCLFSAVMWSAIAYWLVVMHWLSQLSSSGSILIWMMDPAIARRSRELEDGAGVSWFALGAIAAFAVAIFSMIAALKKPIEGAERTRFVAMFHNSPPEDLVAHLEGQKMEKTTIP